MSTRARFQRGYSLVELLTVMAIVGVLSLVTVPAFMNYSKTARLKNSLRQVSSDVRAARARAVTRSQFVRLNVTTASPAPGKYQIEESRDRGATYTVIPGTQKELQQYTYFESDGVFEFRPNGTLVLPAGETSTDLVVKSDDTSVKNNYTITVNLSGKVSTE
jgi:prepilin-type N-terminal cleavage/methylation domain-containing protein